MNNRLSMTRKFFADSGFFTGLWYKRDDNHDLSKEIYSSLVDNHLIKDISDLYISNYIIMEVVHNLQNKGMQISLILEKYEILKSCKVYLVGHDEIDEAFKNKLAPFCSHKNGRSPIGFVDATSLVVMDKTKITHIITYDEGFRKIPLIIPIHNVDMIEQKILAPRR